MEIDTIAAISDTNGEGAIAIVRLSGDEAIQIADKVFRHLEIKHCPHSRLIQFITAI